MGASLSAEWPGINGKTLSRLQKAASRNAGSAEDRTAAVEEYVKQAAEQIMLGNYYEGGVTLLGTIGQLALGFTGLDAAADLRDVAYDVTHWQWTPGHVAQTLVDVLALLPVAGSLKYLDNTGTLVKNGLRGLEGAGTLVKSGLPELKFGLGVVSDAGKNLDNVTELAVNGAKHSDAAKQLAESLLQDGADDLDDALASARRATKGAGDAAAKTGNKTIVIGETMERVKKYAAEIGAETYKEFKYYEKTKAMFGKKLADFIGGVDNALWLIGKMVQKYKIVDLGLDMKRLERSPYYLMESVLAYLYKYKDYAEDFMKGAF